LVDEQKENKPAAVCDIPGTEQQKHDADDDNSNNDGSLKKEVTMTEMKQ